MYIRKIRGCILIVNSVCLHRSSFRLFVIYSIKSKSLNIYHIYKMDKNSRGSRGGQSTEPLCVYMSQALSLLMKRVSWQKGLTRTTLLPL